MLEKIFYGNELQEWVIALLIIVGALVLNKIIRLLNRRVLQKITAKTKNRFDDILVRSLEAPILFGIMLVAIWIAFSHLKTPEKIDVIVRESYKILTTLNITWLFARLLSSLLNETVRLKTEKGKKTHIDNKFLPLVRRSINIGIWIIGGITALGNAGISISALLGTLGIGGIAIALASQDMIKSLLAGVTIFTDHPFQIGDYIRFSGAEGTVEDIGLRSTRIRTPDKRILTVPNSKIMDALIENVDSEPMRRVVLKLSLVYDTTPEKMNEALEILKTIPEKVKYVSSIDLSAAFTDFTQSALVITFIYFVEKKADVTNTSTNVNMEILNSFHKAGLTLALPSQVSL